MEYCIIGVEQSGVGFQSSYWTCSYHNIEGRLDEDAI